MHSSSFGSSKPIINTDVGKDTNNQIFICGYTFDDTLFWAQKKLIKTGVQANYLYKLVTDTVVDFCLQHAPLSEVMDKPRISVAPNGDFAVVSVVENCKDKLDQINGNNLTKNGLLISNYKDNGKLNWSVGIFDSAKWKLVDVNVDLQGDYWILANVFKAQESLLPITKLTTFNYSKNTWDAYLCCFDKNSGSVKYATFIGHA